MSSDHLHGTTMRLQLPLLVLIGACTPSATDGNALPAAQAMVGCLELRIRSDSLDAGMGILADSLPGTLTLRLLAGPVPEDRVRDSLGTFRAEIMTEYGTGVGGWARQGDSLVIRFRSIYMWSTFALAGAGDSLEGWAESGTHRGFYERAIVLARRASCARTRAV